MSSKSYIGLSVERVGDQEIETDIDLSRISDGEMYARYVLSNEIFNSIVPYMPMVTGTFIKRTQLENTALAGTGYICAAAPPMGRFLYEGMGMVGEESGRPWALPGEKKVLVSEYSGDTNAAEYLQFDQSAHPDAQAHWFEVAKKNDLKKWEDAVRRAFEKS